MIEPKYKIGDKVWIFFPKKPFETNCAEGEVKELVKEFSQEENHYHIDIKEVGINFLRPEHCIFSTKEELITSL